MAIHSLSSLFPCCRQRSLTKHERAALLVKNALHGRRLASPTATSVHAQRVYHSPQYRTLYSIAAAGYMLLALAEPPSSIPQLDGSVATARVLDLAFLALAVFDLTLQYSLHGGRTWARRGWVQVRLALILAMFINLLVVLAAPPQMQPVPYILRALRPLFLIERLRNVRRVAGNIASTIPKILNVIILLALHVLFFSVLGFVLFAGIDNQNCRPFRAQSPASCSTFDKDGCTNYFGSLEDAGVQMFELLTAANYPEVIIPVYNCNRFSILFFIAFVVVGIYLLLSLTLAVTYSTFKTLMAVEVVDKYRRMFNGFDMAFVCLTDEEATPAGSVVRNPLAPGGSLGPNPAPNGGTLDDGEVGVTLDDFLRFYAALRPDVDAAAAQALFAVFDVDARGKLYRMEFRRLIHNFAKLTVKRVQPAIVPMLPAVTPLVSASSTTLTSTSASPTVVLSPLHGARTASAAAAVRPLEPQQVASPLYTSSIAGDDDDDDVDVEVLEARARPQIGARASHLQALEEVTDEETDDDSASNATPTPRLSEDPPVEARNRRVESMRALGMAPAPPDTHAHTSSPPLTPDDGTPVGARTPAASMDRGVPAADHAARVDTWPPARPASSRTGQDIISRLCPSLYTAAQSLEVAMRVNSQRRLSLPKQVAPQSWRASGVHLCRSLPVMIACDCVVLINTVAVLVQLSEENDMEPPDASPALVAMRNLQFVMLAFFALEVVGKVLVYGPRAYWREGALARFDIVCVTAAVIGTILQSAHIVNNQTSSVISFFRFIRLLRVLRIIPGFGLTVSAFMDIIPVLLQYMTVILASFYSFAIIGMEAFGGKLVATNPAVLQSSYGASGWWSLNFDSLPGAFVVELYLIVLNDWPVIMEGAVAAVGRSARMYFIMFWLINVVIALNVVVAFVIESFSTQKMKRETLQRLEDEERAQLEASVHPAPQWAARKPHRSGPEDWRELIVKSGIDFSAWRMSRKAHHFDIYDELYKSELRSTFADTFSTHRRGSSRLSLQGGLPNGAWMPPPQTNGNGTHNGGTHVPAYGMQAAASATAGMRHATA